MSRGAGAVLPLLPIALLLGGWQAACGLRLVPASLLPAPATIISRLAEDARTADFLVQVLQTLLRIFAGFGIAAVVGVGLGLAAATSRSGGRVLEPLVRVLAPIPKIALYPALMLVLGFDHASKIALIVADAVFPILLATYHGARRVEPKLIWSARSAGTSRQACPFRVVLPAALPSILTGCRISLVIACVVVFLAEMISSSDGLGHLLIRAARSFRTVDMFVPLVVISLLGLALDAALARFSRWLLAGYPDQS